MDDAAAQALGDKTGDGARPPARAAHRGRPAAPLPASHIAHHSVTHSLRPRGPAVPRQEHRHAAPHRPERIRRRMRPPQGPHHRGDGGGIGAQRSPARSSTSPTRARPAARHARPVLRRPQPLQGGWQLAAPEFIVLGAGVSADLPGLIPIYPATKKLRSWVVMMAVRQVLDLLDDPEDPLPEVLRAAHGLATLGDALRRVHLPDTWEEQRAARRRLVWDEAFGLQLAMAGRRASATSRPAPACPRREDGLAAAFDARLPFALTGAQTHGRRVARRGARRHGAAQPPAAGRRRLGQDDRRAAGDAPGRRRRTAGGAARADRGPRRAARPVTARDARVARTRRGARGLSTSRGPGGHATRLTLLTGSLGAKARREALLDAAVRGRGHRRRHPRGDPAGGRLRRPRPRRRRRAAPLRGAPARRAALAPGRPRAARAGDDGDADPAHGRADRLRRPRDLGARRAAGGPPADRHHRGAGGPAALARPGCGSACARRSTAGTRSTSSARASATRAASRSEEEDQRRRRPARPEADADEARPRGAPAARGGRGRADARRGTARRAAAGGPARPDAHRREGRRDAARSPRARSTCSWPPR